MSSSLFEFAPLSRYQEIFWTFVTSFSFPIFLVYLLLLSQLKFWKNNIQPLEIRKVLIIYNFVISAVNVYCFVGFLRCLMASPSLFDKTHDPQLRWIFYIYWITKVAELLDTVFMVLRHAFRQISTLHVYHHASMLLIADLGYNKYAWATFAMPLMLNALVHIFLYLYYGLTAAGYKPSWKRHLTELQIVQFIIDLVQAGYGLVYHDFCFWSICYGFSMLYMFSSFYVKNYLTAPKSEKKKS